MAASKPAAAPKQPGLTATSQTSRFHVDTISTLSHELDLHQVTVSLGTEDLLTDVHLRLKSGVHYGLVGRNGTGKSSLLSVIGNKVIPGIPENLRILLVDQIEGTDVGVKDWDDGPRMDCTVTERVVQSDKRRNTAMREFNLLTSALEATSVDDLAHAFANIQLERSKAELEEAKKIALRRSGQRGSEARKRLLQAEAQTANDEKQAETGYLGDDLHARAVSLMEDIQMTLDNLDSASTEARAKSILTGLGFKQEMLTAQFSTLSGGWRSRCSLASALLQKPDILLLDEITNYLDVYGVIWLAEYLKALPCTILTVAHDRDFLDAVTDEIVMLRDKKLNYHDGNLSEVERAIKNKRKADIRMQGSMDKRKEQIEKSIEEGARRAKKTNDQTLQKQIKSRQKKLDDRWGLERNQKGHRFHLNRDMGGYHLTSREGITIAELDRPITLPFPDPGELRFPGSLVSADNISFRYTARGPLILEDVDIKVHPGARVALVGRNGEGKSTLVKLLVGQLKPTKGKVEHHARLRFGYFDQHSVEALSAPQFSQTSAAQHFMETMRDKHSINLDEASTRAYLGSFGLPGKKATNPIATLSGGQKVRLALALVVYPAPDLLVLDEVSTHLDMDTIAGLIRALRRYRGAVLLVSHDRHLVRCVVEGAPLLPKSDTADDDEAIEESSTDSEEEGAKEPGQVFMVGPKAKVKLIKSVDDYVALVERRLKKQGLI